MWVEELERVRARAAAFDVAAELAEARERAVRWRPVTSFASFLRPIPLIAQETPRLGGSWADEDDPHTELAGLDEAGRIVALLLDPGREWERPHGLWRYGDGWIEEADIRTGDVSIHRVALDDGRAVRVVSESLGAPAVTLVEWREDEAVRVRRAAGAAGWVRAEARATADGDRILSATEDASDLADALERAARLVPDRLLWDGRIERPEPWPEAPRALAEPLARALDEAFREASAASGIAEPYLLQVFGGAGEQPLFPPRANLAGAEFRDRMRRASRQQSAVVDHLWKGVESGDVAELDVVERLGEDALRACRALSTALGGDAPWSRRREAAPTAEAVRVRLAELLHARPWPGTSQPFLALVTPFDHSGDDPWTLARRVAGDARVDLFLAGAAAVPRADTDALADRALTSRDALEELLRVLGLEAHATRLARELAEEALLLEPGQGRSRLGGPGLLPAGAGWPRTAAGAPLTFLAGIDLGELPDAGPLPPSGWLLFFAALDPDEEELVGEADTAHRVLFAEEVADAEAPGEPLGERRVGFRRVLTVPSGYRVGLEIGLDVYESETYDEAVEALEAALDPAARAARRRMEAAEDHDEEDAWDEEDPWDEEDEEDLYEWEDRPQHWIGGHATGVQGEPPEPGTFLLLHMGWDSELGFEFLDGGAIQFRIPLEALVRRDFARAFAYADSA